MAQCLELYQNNLEPSNHADANNLIDTRCLLIEDGDRLILIDGMGNKQSEIFGYYSFGGLHSMDKSLAKHGFHRDDVTDVL
jgi:hypothetical protein